MNDWRFEEYDFRFEGLDSLERLERIRTVLLKVARGFTEIQPDRLQELIPGKGHAFIVGLETANQVEQLRRHLAVLAKEWNVTLPSLLTASEGRRSKCCFFLLPLKANPDEHGFRRDLFTSERSIQIRNHLTSNAATRTIVFGQWIDEAGELREDSSELYLMTGESARSEKFLRDFIDHRIFDKGEECDQAVIYLSAKGKGHWISEKD